ncbi:MAG TPA: hypothetical protein VLX92_02230 [Kofleriaceae bacterium]|nr:hypothetical protein [Kofleriaceae bacterium]
MRRLLVVLAACGSRAPQPPLAPLPPLPADAGTAAPHSALEPGDPPPSAPEGDPIAIGFVPPKAGDSWQLVTDDDSVIDTVWAKGDTPRKHQETVRKFDYRATVVETAGDHPSKLDVSIATAHEIVDLGDQHQDEELLRGGYLVAAGGTPDSFGHGGVTARRSDGAPLGDREREELESLFTQTLSGADPLPRVLAASPLRLHETRTLDPDQTRAMMGELPQTAKMSVALIAADPDHHRATLELDLSAHDTANGVTVDGGVRAILVYDTVTGALVDGKNVARRVEVIEDMTTTTTARGTRQLVRLR